MTTQVSLYSKQGMPKVFLACLLMIALVGPSWTQAQAQAADCPQVGISDTQQKRFCQEFRKLLYAPYKPQAKRSAPSKKQRSEAEEFLSPTHFGARFIAVIQSALWRSCSGLRKLAVNRNKGPLGF